MISPPREHLSNLVPPLRPGERAVFDFFDAHLAPDWEIYVQPHLNGLRPDFVLLHPSIGIAVFEVKDWNLAACDWRTDMREGRSVVLGTDKHGQPIEKRDPV